jgi:hypothetical protein
VHAAQIAGVAGVAAAPFARCGFKQQHAAAGFARHQRGAQGGIATTDDEYIGVKGFSFHDGLPRGDACSGSTWVDVLCHFRCRSAVDRVRLELNATVVSTASPVQRG